MSVSNFSRGAEFDAYRQTVLNKEGLLNTLDVLEKPISAHILTKNVGIQQEFPGFFLTSGPDSCYIQFQMVMVNSLSVKVELMLLGQTSSSFSHLSSWNMEVASMTFLHDVNTSAAQTLSGRGVWALV